MILRILAISIALVSIGCSRPAPSPGGPRLVSLSPGVTEIIEELGLGATLVGVSQYCRVQSGNPRTIGSLYTLDTEVLLSLQPTHVFYQGNPGRFERLKARRPGVHFDGFRLQTVEDVVLATEQIAELTGQKQKGLALSASLKGKLRAVEQRSASLQPTPVAFVIPSGTGQFLLAVEHNFIDTLLELSGGTNVGRKLAGSAAWQTIPAEQLLSLGAELIIVHKTPMGDSRGQGYADRLRAYIGQSGVALRRVGTTSARYFTIPSNQIGAAADEIFRLIHPDAEAAP